MLYAISITDPSKPWDCGTGKCFLSETEIYFPGNFLLALPLVSIQIFGNREELLSSSSLHKIRIPQDKFFCMILRLLSIMLASSRYILSLGHPYPGQYHKPASLPWEFIFSGSFISFSTNFLKCYRFIRPWF